MIDHILIQCHLAMLCLWMRGRCNWPSLTETLSGVPYCVLVNKLDFQVNFRHRN